MLIVAYLHSCRALLCQGMSSRVALYRERLQSCANASDCDDSIDARATCETTLASIMSTGMVWDLDCCDLEERFRCARMPVYVYPTTVHVGQYPAFGDWSNCEILQEKHLLTLCTAGARTRISYAALIGVSAEDTKSDYSEACKMRPLWSSLEADARALRDRMNQNQSLNELNGPNSDSTEEV